MKNFSSKNFFPGELVLFKKKEATHLSKGKFLCHMTTNVIWVKDEHGRRIYLNEDDVCEKQVNPKPKKGTKNAV